MRKILVTGGTVFVSRFIAEYFVNQGEDVYVLNRGNHEQPGGTTLIEGDRLHMGDKLKGYKFDVVLDINAYTKNDYNNMYIYAKEWVSFAPRQQNANDAYYLALRKMIDTTGDVKYQAELGELRKNIATLNKTANPLTKYYESYTNVIIPK